MSAGQDKRGRLAIIGPYPPPYGGISVHVQRVLAQLAAAEAEYDFYCETSSKVRAARHIRFASKLDKMAAFGRLLFGRYRLIHHHSPHPNVRAMMCILGMLGKRVYMHIHGASLQDCVASRGIRDRVLVKLMKHVHVLADNAEIEELASKLGVRSVTLIDAFLPPMYDEGVLNGFQIGYPMDDLGSADLVLSMVGWFADYKGQDLYGYDTVLDAIERLSDRYRIAVVASVNGIKDQAVYDSFVGKAGESSPFRLIFEELDEIWPLYIVSDVFVRPTVTDGSPLSIKEALWFETPVIASDCVPRPNDVMLFPTGDAGALAGCIESFIERRSELKSQTEKIELVKSKRFENRLLREIYGLG